MQAFTPEQWIVVVLIFLAGLLAGAMLGSGGKWKTRYREEHERYLALQRDHDARTAASNERIAELDRTSPAIGAGTGAAIAGATRGQDDLSLIRSLGPDGAVRLNELGFHRYSQVARMSEADATRIEGQLGAEPGRIERERWREQAELLAAGNVDDHRRRYSSI